MGRQVTAVIFDMDGTLLESHGAVAEAYAATFEALGVPPRSRDEIVRAFPLGPARAILSALLGRPANDEEAETYFRELRARAPYVRAYPGVRRAVASLKERVPLGVFSGASTRSCEILLGAAGLAGFFDAVVGGDAVARPKPAPDGILAACERLGVSSDAVAYVGDSPLDPEAARRAGALAVAAGWGELFDRLHDADVGAETPQDLVNLVPG